MLGSFSFSFTKSNRGPSKMS